MNKNIAEILHYRNIGSLLIGETCLTFWEGKVKSDIQDVCLMKKRAGSTFVCQSSR